MMSIFICGFMGSGKTTFLKKLQETKADNRSFIDTDQEINRLHNKASSKLGDWIEAVGWDQFRAFESELVQMLLDSPKSHVVSLGGGTLTPANLKKILDSDSKLVWLNTPFEVCYRRVEGDAHRPLVRKGEKYLSELYLERESCYAQCHLQLDLVEQQEITYERLLERMELDG